MRALMLTLWGGLVVAALVGGLLIWGELIAQRASYRFRVTVDVATPAGLRSGSSVYEVAARYRADLQPGGKKREWVVRGEAVAVTLPNGRTLLALLRTRAAHEDLAGMSMNALDPRFRNDVVESAHRLSNGAGVRDVAAVALGDYPLMVTFRDRGDPMSIVEVDPTNSAASLGAGMHVRGVAVARTDAPVTDELVRHLDDPFWQRWAKASRHVKNMDRTKGESSATHLLRTLFQGDFARR